MSGTVAASVCCGATRWAPRLVEGPMPTPAVPARHEALDQMDGALLLAIELLSDPEWIARRLSAQHDPAQEGGEHLVDQPQHHQRIMPGHLP